MALLLAAPSLAATCYVSPTGDDEAPGTAVPPGPHLVSIEARDPARQRAQLLLPLVR